jgi:hypothetical protein
MVWEHSGMVVKFPASRRQGEKVVSQCVWDFGLLLSSLASARLEFSAMMVVLIPLSNKIASRGVMQRSLVPFDPLVELTQYWTYWKAIAKGTSMSALVNRGSISDFFGWDVIVRICSRAKV